MLRRYSGKPAIYDSNVLLLHLAAHFDPSLIHSFKRLGSFSQNDLEILSSLSRRFSSISTTPHVLTEVGNFVNELNGKTRKPILPWFGSWLAHLPEIFVEAVTLGSLDSFHKFGITDSCLANLAARYVIVTIDFPLAGFLHNRGLSVINFTNLRAAWLFS